MDFIVYLFSLRVKKYLGNIVWCDEKMKTLRHIYLFISYGLTSSSDSKDHYSRCGDDELDINKLCSSHHLLPPPFEVNGPNDPIWQILKDPDTGSLQR
jgi:hypothetical protein